MIVNEIWQVKILGQILAPGIIMMIKLCIKIILKSKHVFVNSLYMCIYRHTLKRMCLSLKTLTRITT